MSHRVRRAGLARFQNRDLCRQACLLAACAVCWASASDVQASGHPVRAVTIGGRELTGIWIGSTDGKEIRLQTEDGLRTIRLDGLARLSFPKKPNRKPPHKGEAAEDDLDIASAPTVFHLADGGWITGALLDKPQIVDALAGRTSLGEASIFPYDRLAGIQLATEEVSPRAHKLFLSALARRLPGQDVLITRGVDDVKTVHGRLVALDTKRGRFVFDKRERTFRTDTIYGLVFAAAGDRLAAGNRLAGGSDNQISPYPLTVELAEGSRFSGRLERADRESLRLFASIGQSVDLALEEVLTLQIHSDRVVYLSDLSPIDQRVEGLLHRPWPWHKDRSVSGTVLSLAGRTFEKGIGVHSKTELSFDIAGVYETFAATIGINDSVRPRGSVVFHVLGDGATLFESQTLTGRDAPQDIIIDITNVTKLTLLVDYGDELDLSDHADWGGARLLKPSEDAESGP